MLACSGNEARPAVLVVIQAHYGCSGGETQIFPIGGTLLIDGIGPHVVVCLR